MWIVRNSLSRPKIELHASDPAQFMLAGQVPATMRPAGRSRSFLGLGELVGVTFY